MSYIPIQTINGRKLNIISIWEKPNEIDISFTLDKSTDFETRLSDAGLRCHYVSEPRHLHAFVSELPNDEQADNKVLIVLKSLAVAAAREVLPRMGSRKRKKMKLDNPIQHGATL